MIGGIGTWEIMVILVVALIVLGPSKLPEIARTLGKGLREFRRMTTDVQRTINLEVERDELERQKKKIEEDLFGEKKRAKKAEETPDHDKIAKRPEPEPEAEPEAAAESYPEVDAARDEQAQAEMTDDEVSDVEKARQKARAEAEAETAPDPDAAPETDVTQKAKA